MAEFVPLLSEEENNDAAWYTAGAAGIGSGLFQIPKGVFSLAAELIDLGFDAYGLDISDYGIKNSPNDIIGRLHKGTAEKLIFKDNSFDFVFSLNTIHNLTKSKCLIALKEIERVSKGKSFVQVDSYKNLYQKKKFLNWVLTAKYHDYPKNWLKLFKKAKYSGDWYWTIV